MQLSHTGASGLRLTLGGARLSVDPREATVDPVVLTWSEAERVAGSRARTGLTAAEPALARWLGIDALPLEDGVPCELAGWSLLASTYRPIPYAVPAEAVRKTLSAVRNPVRAARRLAHTLRRPGDLPHVVSVRRDGVHVALIGQALHRFTDPATLARLVERHGGADVLVAGTDFEDEEATGRLMGAFDARRTVLVDAIGPVRRALDLPVRPLEVTLAVAPSNTLALREGETIELR